MEKQRSLNIEQSSKSNRWSSSLFFATTSKSEITYFLVFILTVFEYAKLYKRLFNVKHFTMQQVFEVITEDKDFNYII